MPDGFLRSWVATHVRPVPAADRAQHVAKWAASCVADAIMAGIPYDDLQKAAGGSILTHIGKAAELVAERETSLSDDAPARSGASFGPIVSAAADDVPALKE